MNWKLRIALAWCFMYGLSGWSQESEDTTSFKRLTKFPLFTTDYYHYPESTFDTQSGKGKIEVNEIRSSLQIAFPLKEKKVYMFNAFQHSLFKYQATVEQAGTYLDESYNSFQYTLGVIQVLPKRWQMVLTFSPTLASDFREPLQSDDFIFQMSGLVYHRSSPDLEYGFGVAYTSQFGSPLVVPLFNFTRSKNQWLTVAVLPSYIIHSYKFNDNTRLGIKAAVSGNLYNISPEDNTSTLDLNRVSYSRITIGPEFLQRLVGDLYLNIGVGVSVRNKLEVQDDDLNNELVLDVKQRLFLNIGLKVLK